MHSWQDWVLAISFLSFNLALLPSVKGKHKPRTMTCVMTFAAVIPVVIVFASLSLWYSFAMACINASLWATLALQRHFQLRAKA